MNDGNFLPGLFCCLIVPVVITVALVFLVRQTREEEAKTKLEVQQIVSSLPPQSQSAFLIQYNAQSKNSTTAVVLTLLLGGIGIHKFYLGQTGWGIVYLLFCWTLVPSILAFFEAFTISQYVHKANRQVAKETAAMLGGDAVYQTTNMPPPIPPSTPV
jgi:TM2 domain-containing membrane protein YozV